tara:strand:- start:61 stop:267 length:207 start_codon:yes stop_codon:yes gene_type:complete
LNLVIFFTWILILNNKKKGVNRMTANQFSIICGELLIDEGIALENQNIIQALKQRNNNEVIELLKTEF